MQYLISVPLRGFLSAYLSSIYTLATVPPIQLLVPNPSHYTRMLRLMDRCNFPGLVHRWGTKPTTPCLYIPIPLHTPDDMLTIDTRMGHALIARVKEERNIRLLLDLSSEAIVDDHCLLALHRNLEKLGIDGNRIHLINANASTCFYDRWAQSHSPHYRIHCHGYHFYLYAITQKLLLSPRFIRYQQRLRNVAQSNTLRPYHFMCLNLKAHPHRIAILLFLLRNHYLEKGRVTYIGSDFGPKQPEGKPYAIPPALKNLMSRIPDADSMLAGYDRLERMRPLTYERPANAVSGIWKTPAETSYIIPDIVYHRGKTRIDTYFEIVTETYFTDARTLYITEKTLRPILRFQPFIHAGSPFVLKALRDMGFKTFSPLIDESYDGITDPGARLAAIFNEIRRLCDMPKEELHRQYMTLWDVYEHNFRHLTTNLPALFAQDVKANILDRLAVWQQTHKQAA